MNESQSIAKVIYDLPTEITRRVVVCDNGSTDDTIAQAERAGAIVVQEPKVGYGSACLRAMKYISDHEPHPDIVVFIDGDYSDYPEELTDVVKPILDNRADLVIGSRALGNMETGSMTIPQLFGNWLATRLIKIIYRYQFTDLGPFRAIRYPILRNLKMSDPDYGWTVEMQVKAAKMGIRSAEVPVKYRKRIGKSKISGTIKGTFLAGQKILWTIFKSI